MRTRDFKGLLRRPLVVAPMAGGPSTPALVAAAAEAGAVGFLAAGYKTAAEVTSEIAAVRTATSEPFGVNLFVPGSPTVDRVALSSYLDSLARDAAAVGAALGEPSWDDDGWDAKLAALLAAAPPMVSFTFGCPAADIIEAFQGVGSVVAVTVTRPQDAETAAAAGADALCVQGFEAGAHRATFRNDEAAGQDYGLLALIGEVGQACDLPQIAAGGIAGPRQVQAVLAAGAVAAQCGTAFLRCPESGAHPAYKAALADPRHTTTAVTRAFSGRRARGIVNRFLLEHSDAPAAYPEINNATRALRAAAADHADLHRMSLWAGQGFRSTSDRPAGETIEFLCPQR
ncbi:MAG: nitronate monooxygenase [Mycobacteriales bacterium]